jgi:hypothetical protein
MRGEILASNEVTMRSRFLSGSSLLGTRDLGPMIAEKKDLDFPTVGFEAPIGMSIFDFICCICCKTDRPCDSWQSHTKLGLLANITKQCSTRSDAHVSAPRYEPYQRLRNPLPHSFLHVCGSARCLHSFRPTCCPTVSTSKAVRPGLLDATDTPRSPSPSPCPAIRRYHALLFHLAIAGRVPSIRYT